MRARMQAVKLESEIFKKRGFMFHILLCWYEVLRVPAGTNDRLEKPAV